MLGISCVQFFKPQWERHMVVGAVCVCVSVYVSVILLIHTWIQAT